MSSVVPRITGEYKIIKNLVKMDLNKITESYLEVFNYQGLGNLYSVITAFNNHAVMLKLTIDGTEIFEVNGANIDKHFGSVSGSGGTKLKSMFQLDKTKDAISFEPRFPILFRESIVIEAKANSNSTSRDFEAVYVELSEE